MIQLGLKDSSRNYTRGYRMSFVSYRYLLLLISGQTFEVTVALFFFLESKQSPLCSKKKARFAVDDTMYRIIN